MRRFLRLMVLVLIALALPLQGALAATAMARHASPPHQAMTMPDGHEMDAADMPCHPHAADKTGCGDCCGPLVLPQALLDVAPVAVRWAALPAAAGNATPVLFLTGGTDRPPRAVLA